MARKRKSRDRGGIRTDGETWYASTTIGVVAKRGDLKLMVAVTQVPMADDLWSVLALETPESGVAELLDNHAHEMLGEFSNFELAQKACKVYVKKWIRKQERLGRCECKPIASVESLSSRLGVTIRGKRTSKTSGVTN